MNILAIAFLSLHHIQVPIEEIDSMAKARNVAGISALVENLDERNGNPLQVIKTNGAYECGRFGWRAYEMRSSDSAKTYVVLSTPLTSEDTGEFLFERDGGKLRLIHEDQDLGIKVLRNRLDVRFELSSKRAQLQDELSIRSSGQGDFVFRMSPEFRVSSVKDVQGTEVGFSQAGGVVLLKKPAQGEATFSISYDGIVDKPLYSGSITDSEATLTNCYWYPMIARQPAPYDVTAHYPSNWIAVGQGEKIKESAGSCTFRMDLPCIFYSLSAGPYKTGSFQADGRTYYAWSPRLSSEALETQAETYAETIKFYSRFAPFPFKSYGGLDSPQYGGGALEAYSYATYGGGFPYVDAHEPSHTWWGGILECNYLHSFWNESFADYSDALFHRRWTGNLANDDAFVSHGEAQDYYDEYACSRSGAHLGPAASSLGYGKGSHVLYMLERLIGEEAMERCMARFVKNQPKQKDAEWEDFEEAAEEECPDAKLGSFFADWLNRPGHLEFSATVGYRDGAVEISYSPKIPFRIPLQVMLQFADGRRKFKIFDVREAGVLRFESEKPLLVSVDPYRYLIRHVHSDETPMEIGHNKSKMDFQVDPAHKDWARGFGDGDSEEGSKSGDKFFIGKPETLPEMAEWCKRAGFTVDGDILTYKSKKIDLKHGGAEAVLDLGNGHFVGMGLGKMRISPDPGSSSTAVFDDLGRFVDGETQPKTQGFLTFKL